MNIISRSYRLRFLRARSAPSLTPSDFVDTVVLHAAAIFSSAAFSSGRKQESLLASTTLATVSPAWLLVVTSAPLLTKSSTSPALSCLTARMSGVSPSSSTALTSAPLAISSSATLTASGPSGSPVVRPYSATRSSGVCLPSSAASTLAPASSSMATVGANAASAAKLRAAAPCESALLTSAPASTSAQAICMSWAGCDKSQAMMSGVAPVSVCALTSAPASIRSLTHPSSDASTAHSKAVNPVSSM
mmetsp:Transcript_35692/g.68468  ORF Transcript_35692/g.68468 Transcript_35692/m.68468 type:complete len:247 (-) Transcript_35692:306-1046(-)